MVYNNKTKELSCPGDATLISNDVYVIAVPGEKDILLPALKIYVKEINLAEKRIVVTLPEWVDEA